MKDKNVITVIVRSFIPLLEPSEGFNLGEPFKITIPEGMTSGELAQKILSKNVNQLGIVAVNGKKASENTILAEGDKIDLYALLDGG
jgi:sulfur carrier protein ThiS